MCDMRKCGYMWKPEDHLRCHSSGFVYKQAELRLGRVCQVTSTPPHLTVSPHGFWGLHSRLLEALHQLELALQPEFIS